MKEKSYLFQEVFFTPSFKDVLVALADIALPERWSFKNKSSDLPILWSYFTYTYEKADKDKLYSILELENGVKFKAINTGLVGRKTYEPIYAIVVDDNNRSERRTSQWTFYCFLEGAEAVDWKKCFWTINYKKVPNAPRCINDFPNGGPSRIDYRVADNHFEIEKAKSKSFMVDYLHILEDNLTRFPKGFLRNTFIGGDFDEIWRKLKSGELSAKNVLEQNKNWRTSLINFLKISVDKAILRTEWDFRTAIPTYFPTTGKIQYLLPISMGWQEHENQDDIFDLALVVNIHHTGGYRASTVLTLEMAYNDSRLICRPHKDWLIPEKIDTSKKNKE